jgi:hypothetical protein
VGAGGVHDGVASHRGRGDAGRVEHIVAVGDVEADDVIALGAQARHDGAADQATASGHQYPHRHPFTAAAVRPLMK